MQQNNGWYVLPRTRAGWWAVALCVAFFVSVAVTGTTDTDLSIGRLNVVGAFNFLLAIAGGALALYAMVRRGERSFVVLIPLLPALLAVGFELAEALSSSD
jgi:hypothetical protein